MRKHLLPTCLLPLALVLPAYADFIAVSGRTVYRANENTGVLQYIGAASATGNLDSLTRDPTTNTFYTVDVLTGVASRLYTLDPNTGQTTPVDSLPLTIHIEALAAAPQGGLLYAAGNGNTLYTIDPHTGFVATVGSMGPVPSAVDALAFAPDGTLYGYNNQGGEGALLGPGFFRVDPATAAITVLTPAGTAPVPQVDDMAFAPNGTLWAAQGESFLQLDPRTGLQAGPDHLTIPVIQGMAFLPDTAVPEPSTYLLLGAGLLGLFAFHRRNQSR